MPATTFTSRTAAAICVVAVSTLLAPAGSACGKDPRWAGPVASLPNLPNPTLFSLSAGLQDDSEPLIPGLWKTVFASGGVVVNVGFDTFHSDGTEFALDGGFPPAQGNVCPGVWQKIAPRTYITVHPAFNYDAAGINIISIFIERVHVTIGPDGNSFAGTFTWGNYDSKGNLLPGSVVGTLTGTRISVGEPFPFPFPL